MPTKTRGKKAPVKRKTTKIPAKESVVVPRPRRLRLPAYRPFRWKRITYPEKLPSVWQLTGTVARTTWRHKRFFASLAILYIILNLIFVRGLSNNLDVGSLKSQLGIGSGVADQLSGSLLVLTSFFSDSGATSNPAGGAYQLFLGLIISLATIWALRQITSGHAARLKDALYNGMYPLVQFILVLVAVLLQLIPLVIGAALFTVVVVDGIAATGLEAAVAGAIFLVLAFVSLYMLCASLFALYIVTLPDMTPRKALKSARQLVQYRRGQVFRKLLYLPVALLVAMALLMVPVIILVAAAAPWLFFALGMCALIVVHVYMYTLYKALLA